MKELQEIIKQEPVYLNEWKGKIDIISDFNSLYMSQKEYEAATAPYPNVERWEQKKKEMTKALLDWSDINILFASYGNEDYSGSAWVLFKKDGKLFEVNAGHCSCNGLGGEWNPSETSLEELKHRLEKGTLGDSDYSGNIFATELKKFLGLNLCTH